MDQHSIEKILKPLSKEHLQFIGTLLRDHSVNEDLIFYPTLRSLPNINSEVIDNPPLNVKFEEDELTRRRPDGTLYIPRKIRRGQKEKKKYYPK